MEMNRNVESLRKENRGCLKRTKWEILELKHKITKLKLSGWDKYQNGDDRRNCKVKLKID